LATDFVNLEGKSRGYRLALAVLALLALGGLISFIISYIQGHQVFGSNNVIPWGMPIVLAIYLIGLSAGSLILSSLTYVFGREEYKPVSRLAIFLAIVLIFGALISIAIDLGRPEKFWRLFMFFYLNNMRSMFAINGILYGGYFIISFIYLGIVMASKMKAAKIMGTIAVCWAVLVHMGTGAIFGFIAARETWFSPMKPLEFLAAALTSGMALLIVAVVLTMIFTKRSVKKEMVSSLGRLLIVFIVILTVLIAIDKLTHLYSPARGATIYMLAGPYSWIFWVLQIGLVVVVPLAILVNRRLNGSIGWISLAAVSVVIGVFFERYFLVIPGAAYPMEYYPGHIEGVWGAVQSFPLKPAEMMLSVGIIAALVLIFMLGLKYMELLPVKEEVEEPIAPAGEVPEATEESSAEAEAPADTTPPEETAPANGEATA
jgi:Ni/Fe-hydrogenase subunit HybB-like protein